MTGPIAQTTAGEVEGLEKGDILQFRGIRYARAARFGPPEPVEPWTGVQPATRFGMMAPQNPSSLEAMMGANQALFDEDCLFLNVFTPAIDDRQRPVLFWIHGGGFTAGSGSMAWYDGTPLARAGDVVVVTINYRLAALGFMAVEGFPGSGNNGIRDQIAALRWVHDNIAAFGGDPGNVTIFGESAGGMSVGTLLGTPDAAGLFHRAIAQSGAASNASTPPAAAAVTERILVESGLRAGDDEALLGLDVDTLLAAQQRVNEALQGRNGQLLPFQPVVDGVVLPQRPLDAIRGGLAADVHVIAGATRDEWKLFSLMDPDRAQLDEERLRHRLARMMDEDLARATIDAYRDAYPEVPLAALWSQIATDRIFRIPALRLAEVQSAHQPHTYSYLFTYESKAFDGAMGAAHAVDIPFVFDNLHRRGTDWLLGGIDDDARALATAASRAWLALAVTGTPNHDGLPEWRPYSVEDRAVMELGRDRRILVDPDGEIREFWASVA